MATHPMKLRPGIVHGCPRSGTTFLLSVINALPHVACMNGTLLSVSVPQIVHRELPPDVYEALAVGFERSLNDYLESGRFNSRARALQKWFQSPTGLSGLLRAAKGQHGVDMLVYKEPFLSFAPGFVLDAFPDAPIIYIHRDGRDVANSLVRSYGVLTDNELTHLRSSEVRLGRKVDDHYVPWWVDDGREEEFLSATPYVRAIWMWKVMVQRCHEIYAPLTVDHGGNVLIIEYEAFMREPEAHGEEILRHLGQPSSSRFRKRLGAAHSTSIGKHTHRQPSEIREAERIAGDELRLLGYELTESASVS